MSQAASNKWFLRMCVTCVCLKVLESVSPLLQGWTRVVSVEAWWLVGTWLIKARCYPAFLCYLGGDDLGDEGAVFLWI